MSTPFVSTYLKVAADDSDRPANPVEDDDFDTSPEMIAFRFEADTQTLIFWDPVNEEYLTVALGVASGAAEDITYDNAASGLAATDVQAAIDELDATIDGLGAGYTDEQAQDAVGAMVDASLTYVDGTPLLQRAALTGDVTASAGSNATTIAAGAVTPAKLTCLSARVKKASDQTAANYSAGAVMDFDTEEHDDGAWHDGGTPSRLTVPAGVTKAMFFAQVRESSGTSGALSQVRIVKNGSTGLGLGWIGTGPSNTARFGNCSTGPISVTAGDYFEVFYVSSDASVTIEEDGTFFSALAIG